MPFCKLEFLWYKGEAHSGTVNYAVFGEIPSSSTPCTGPGCSDAAAYFNGDAFCSTGTLFITSDSTYKKNILPMQNASQILKQVNAYSYVFDTTKTHGLNVGKGLQYGLISQEVNNVLPGLVKNFINPEQTDSAGNVINPQLQVLGLNLIGMIPILLGGYKEQQGVIDSLTTRLTNLETIVNSCCSIAARSTGEKNSRNNQSVELKNITTIFLDQNKPNPFADQTDIDYFLPAEVRNAEMWFFDQTGQKIKSVTLNERGKGTLHVYSPDLKNGTYTYSLIADGKVIETKTMVKTR